MMCYMESGLLLDPILSLAALIFFSGPLYYLSMAAIHYPFEDINAPNRVRQKVSISNWDMLIAACVMFGILPTTRH